MATSTAELTLLLKAKNLADNAMQSVVNKAEAITTKAGEARRALGDMGSSLSAGLGNLTENLLTGQDLGQAAVNLGAFLAGETVQEFGTGLISKFAGSAIVQTVTGALAGFGSTIGGVISTAIPVGMAAAPALIIGAIALAITALIASPELREKVFGFAGDVIKNIVGGLAGLGGKLVEAFAGAWKLVVDGVGGFVGQVVGWWLSIPGKLLGLGLSIVTTIIGGLVSLPGKIADVVRQAFANLKIDIGPFHVSASGVRIDLPSIDPTQYGVGRVPHYAGGGWAGLHGPELAVLGESGPEYVVSNDDVRSSASTSSPAVRILGVSEEDIIDMVDRGLYFRLARAVPTDGR